MDKQPKCSGDVTFNEIYSYAHPPEWPDHVPGIICKMPPVGRMRAPRFAECCSGKVYNITSPTSPDDPAYPVSCATFCQISPEMDAHNDANPYGWSDHFMCLTDGGRETSNWEVGCGTVTVAGVPMPTSFPNTPVNTWKTIPWTTNEVGQWTQLTASSETSTSRATTTEKTLTTTRTRPSNSSSATDSTGPTATNGGSRTQTGAAAATTTSSSNAASVKLSTRNLLVAVVVMLAAYRA